MTKAKSTLTESVCELAAPKSHPYRLYDEYSLHLFVKPTGGKLWRWRYRYNGKSKTMSYGRFPLVSVTEARLRHADARTLLANGINPMTVKKGNKLHKQEEARTQKMESVSTASKKAQEALIYQLINVNCQSFEKLTKELLVASSHAFEQLTHDMAVEMRLSFKSLSSELANTARIALEEQNQKLLALSINPVTIQEK